MTAMTGLSLRNIDKRYGGVHALRDISIDIEPGKVHALVGENGAGKSTLGKIVAGVERPDGGEILLDGEPIAPRSPAEALRHGIAIVHQEIALVPQLTAIENIFLGAEESTYGFLRKSDQRAALRQLTEDTGLEVEPDAIVGSLRVAYQQRIEILRAVSRGARVIVMDEPTAALSVNEATRLYETVRRLADRGVAVIYVSHFLNEVLRLADTVTIFKDGRLIRTAPAEKETPETLLSGMLGMTLDATFPDKPALASDAPVRLRVDGLSAGSLVHDVSLTVRAGEIVGLAGLVGSGRTELARAIWGADPISEGMVEIDGSPVHVRGPAQMCDEGLAYIPEDRKQLGLILHHTVAQNVSLPHLRALSRGGMMLTGTNERAQVNDMIARLDVRPRDPDKIVRLLSGGNQQKVLFAKWLMGQPGVLLADEPTRGVDVGAKHQIYQLLVELARSGLGVLLISSEMEEIMGLAHRILVMRGGTIVEELGGDADNQQILTAAFGEKPVAA